MKNLKEYLIFNQNAKGNINEGLLNRKITTKAPIRYKPKTGGELQNIIVDLLKKGITDLNCIDVSNITNMDWLFCEVSKYIDIKDIDISKWNVSNVTSMEGMFDCCKNFNSDLSNWDVSNVKYMDYMFEECECFDCDLSNWDVSKVELAVYMFRGCTSLKKNNKIPNWYKGQA